MTMPMPMPKLVFSGRSKQTPPPQERARVEFTYGCPFCG